MSVQTPARPRAAGAELIRRARGRYLSPLASLVLFAVLFLAVIARYEFASPAQVFLNLLVDNAYLIVLAVGMNVRDPHRRYRSQRRRGGRAVHRHPGYHVAGRLADAAGRGRGAGGRPPPSG